MLINSVQPYCLNTNNTNKFSNRNYKESSSFVQNSDVFFRSAVSSMPEKTRNFQREAIELFRNPKYKVSSETFKNIFDNILRCASGMYDEEPINIFVSNEHQLNFIENILAHNIEPDHPIVKKAGLDSDSVFYDAFKDIKTEENMQARSAVIDFFMKHPENIHNLYSIRYLLTFSKNECHKKHMEFIDKNYETITQKLHISNKKLMNYLDTIMMAMRYEFDAHIGEDAEKLWNVLMGTGDILDIASLDRKFKKGTPEYNKACNERRERIKSFNKYYLNDWYLDTYTKDNEKTKGTIKELQKTLKKYNIDFCISARELGEILYCDENITVPELLFISETCKLIPSGNEKWNYLKNLIDTYKAASTIGINDWKKVIYNENNRKFLWYTAASLNALYPSQEKDFLNKFVLESIQTPEQLATAIELYDTVHETKTQLNISAFDLSKMIGKYNLSAEDILKINARYKDDNYYYAIMESLRNGTYNIKE